MARSIWHGAALNDLASTCWELISYQATCFAEHRGVEFALYDLTGKCWELISDQATCLAKHDGVVGYLACRRLHYMRVVGDEYIYKTLY